MTRYLYMQQEGEGCDYTIGCGETLVELKTGSEEEILHVLESNSFIGEYVSKEKKLKRCFLLELVKEIKITTTVITTIE